MSQYYIYAPFSGQIWAYPPSGSYCYLTGTHYPGCGLGSQEDGKPMDIGAGWDGAGIYFHASTNVLSVQTIRQKNCLCNVMPPEGYGFINKGVLVKLYWGLNADPSSYIGAVLYAHIKNRIANGIYNNPNGLLIGTLGPDCNCDCSRGIHIHMAKSGGAILNPSLYCGQFTSRGGTLIYTFFA